MKKDQGISQLVVRLSPALERKIKKEAKKEGLTKAAWARKLFIKTIDSLKNPLS